MKNLIQTYIDGWKENDPKKILSVLSEDCIIIESHGPLYEGKDIISKWVDDWLPEGKVTKWDVLSFYEIEDMAFFEWIFDCTHKSIEYHIEGISLAKLKNNKIVYLREYRTTEPIFPYK